MSTVSNWTELMEIISTNNSSGHIWRGETDSARKLISGIGRPRAKKHYSEKMEKQLFESFKQKIIAVTSIHNLDQWDILALAQHVGVPTRLLDWSLSPLTALFFALEGEKETDRTLYTYKIKSMVDAEERKKDPFDLKVTRAFIPAQFHPRIKAQRGVFTVHRNPCDEFKSSNLKRYIIPSKEVGKMRRLLFKMGVDYWSIYPDTEGLGRQLQWQFLHGVPQTG